MRQAMADLINVIFGFRKFILMILLFIVAVVFRVKNLISGADFVELLKATTVSFFAANGVEHIMTTIRATMGRQPDLKSKDDNVVDADEPDSSASEKDTQQKEAEAQGIKL